MKIGEFNVPDLHWDLVSREQKEKIAEWSQVFAQVLRSYIYLKRNPNAKGPRPNLKAFNDALVPRIKGYSFPSPSDLPEMSDEELSQLERFVEHTHLLEIKE